MSRFRRVDPPGSRGRLLELSLSPRQREVIRGMFRWGSRKDVARELGLRPDTVRNYLCEVYRRVGVSNVCEAAYELYLRDPWGER